MRIVVVGLGVQGRKRVKVAGLDLVATVDPVSPEARFRSIQDVPLDSYDAALVCVPDSAKFQLLQYLLSHGKHVLVEKPLLTAIPSQWDELKNLAAANKAACYTAYNHRFEPHLVRLRDAIERKKLGKIYYARMFYGNGTAADVKKSPWRDQGAGVLTDLGSHLLDLTLFLFGPLNGVCEAAALHRFENQAWDHALFQMKGEPFLEFEVSLVSWRNTFRLDVFGELGSAHVEGLCKWGPSAWTFRRRAFPSGKPEEETSVWESPDPTWEAEYVHFKEISARALSNLENDRWIHSRLKEAGGTLIS